MFPLPRSRTRINPNSFAPPGRLKPGPSATRTYGSRIAMHRRNVLLKRQPLAAPPGAGLSGMADVAAIVAVFTVLLFARTSMAQDTPADEGGAEEAEAPELLLIQRNDRRAVPAGKVVVSWDEITVPETLPWIAQMTGKVVMPVSLIALKSKKISLHTDEPIEQADVLDMLFQAFRLNSVGVIEQTDVVIIGMIDEIKLVREMPIITADESIADRVDRGTLVVKIFKLTEVPAAGVYEQLEEISPTDATHPVDPNSNQIVVMGAIGL